MNHSFVRPYDGSDKCSKCKFPEIAHGNLAVCECCPNIGPVDIHYGNILMCDACWKKEQSLQKEIAKPENQQKRIDAMYAAMDASRLVDSKVTVRTDLFNSATESIVDLKKLIDENPDITNKAYALAEALTERFNTFKKAIFDYNEKLIEATNNQKAIQVYLNNLADKLRAEEREKLKLSDINYNPSVVKTKKESAPKVRKSKIDKAEIKKYAAELGVSDFTLQMVCVAQGISPEQAANKLRKSINELKSESN